ncbi:MAG: single-stranded-DNA-specific exonuclease RecJ [Succinivibrio sp.]|nr:single-stranded-DNA-specific exonuclease RecJ [Succinivibrio sp.]
MKIVRRSHVPDEHLALTVSDPLLRQLLARRGVNNADDLNCEIGRMLHYRDLKDIDRAASVLADALQNDEHIMIAGDYDVDGLTGTALGVRCLKAMGADMVDYYVPSRYEGGYGLTSEVVEAAAARGVALIVTVDNGISCDEAAQTARSLGVKLVITDHHEPLTKLPDALAVVDPKRCDDTFASKNLCGAGVLFYVLIALRAELRSRGYFSDRPEPVLSEYLDLVAFGTIGDVVPLDVNNRRLVRAGMRRINRGLGHMGIRTLIENCRLKEREVRVQNISFELCPRLNAAGRIKLTDNPAIKLLLCDDHQEACELAVQLDMCNRRRGDFERVALAQAQDDAKAQENSAAITLYRPQWLSGIAGLIAGRIKEQYHVPCIVFTGNEDVIQGSARSVKGISLAKILNRINEEHPGMLRRFGGHAMAAGAALDKSRLDEFTELFDKAATATAENGCDDEIITDGELPPDHASITFARDLEEHGPWGNGFPEPWFDGEFTIGSVNILGNRHLRLGLYADSGLRLNAIRFRASPNEKALTEGVKVKVVYALGIDRYYSDERLEVRIESIEPV